MTRLTRDPGAVLVDATQLIVRRLSPPQPPGPLLAASRFPFLSELERRAPELRQELLDTLLERVGTPPDTFELNGCAVGVTGHWRIVPLFDRRGPLPLTAGLVATLQVLGAIPGLRAADVAQLDARSAIHPHRGHNVGVLRAHLTLAEPEGPGDCELRFPGMGLAQPWQTGRAFVFDDLFEHAAVNDRAAPRLILHLELDRPGGPLFRTANGLAQRLYRYHPIQRGVRTRVAEVIAT